MTKKDTLRKINLIINNIRFFVAFALVIASTAASVYGIYIFVSFDEDELVARTVIILFVAPLLTVASMLIARDGIIQYIALPFWVGVLIFRITLPGWFFLPVLFLGIVFGIAIPELMLIFSLWFPVVLFLLRWSKLREKVKEPVEVKTFILRLVLSVALVIATIIVYDYELERCLSFFQSL